MRLPFTAFLSRAFGRAPAARSLEAAGAGRRWKDDRASVDAASWTRAGASTVAARAQAYVFNNPHGARITEGLVANLVSTGITPRPQHPAPAVRERLAQAWLAWTDRADPEGRSDFYGLTTLMVRDLIVLGEGLAAFGMDADGAPQLQRLHPEQLARDVTRQLADGG
jgi:capsid protein